MLAFPGQREKRESRPAVPWLLQSATMLKLEQNVLEHSGVAAPLAEPLIHFSSGVDVRIGRPVLV
jgi:uncharacterized protein YqjF (DUF2071 family)